MAARTGILLGMGVATAIIGTAAAVDPALNGVPYPAGWQDWKIIAPSYRTDNNTIRIVVGNDVAVAAARSGQTNPWPDGAVLGKIVWRDSSLPNWEPAKAPAAFVHAEFMFKDSRRHAATKGWAWARWLGTDQRPYGADANFHNECIACHAPVADRDHVFTAPAILPKP